MEYLTYGISILMGINAYFLKHLFDTQQAINIRLVKVEEKTVFNESVLKKILSNQESMQTDIHLILTKLAVIDKG